MMMRNQKGLSVAELLVGIGLSAVVISVVISVQVQIAKEQNKLTRELDDSIDQNLAERITFKNLNGVEISYNNIVVKDDNGNNFFDYYPDITENILTTKTDRDFTLIFSGKKEFYVVTQDVSAGPLLNYDPVWAYVVGADPGDPNKPASLTFSPANNRKYITNADNGGRPAFWKDGNLLMFDTPNRIRPAPGGVIDMKVPPRSPIYIGSVSTNAGDSLQSLSNEAAALFKNTQPYNGKVIDSLDTFLRTLPSVGGGQTLVRARVVKIAKYYVTPDNKKNSADYYATPLNLYVAEYRNGTWAQPTLLADGVEKMIFRRDSVLKRMIYFKIYKAQKRNGSI